MRKVIWGISLLVLAAGFLPEAASAHSLSCSLAGVAGSYGYTSSGTIVTPPVGPFAAVGHVTFTESGTFSGAQTTSIAGNLVEETVTGTYTVNPDCTGTAVVNVFHGSTLARTTNLHLVFDNDENAIRAIFLSAGTAISIDAKRVFHRDLED